MLRHQLSGYVPFRIVDEITDWVRAQARLRYDLARSVAINARHKLPGADNVSRDIRTAPTTRRTKNQTPKDEITRRDNASTLHDLTHLTRIRLQFVVYFLPFRGKTGYEGGEMPNAISA